MTPSKLFILHHNRFCNLYGTRLVDAETPAIVNYLLLKVDKDEREPLRVIINQKRKLLGLIPIYKDYL